MIDLTDKNEKIKQDFGNNAFEVFAILSDAVSKIDYLDHPRIIRCILFLDDQDLLKVKSYIQTAMLDPRDVMFLAEYTSHDTEKKPKKIRDFKKPFDQSETNVSE